MSQLKYWVWLSSLGGIGAVTAGALLRHFGTPEGIFAAKADDYRDIDGIRAENITALTNKSFETANKILASCEETGCRVLTLQDAEYPDRLRNIYDPPITLYVKGTLPVIDEEPIVAIVGTRTCTPYGFKASEKIGYQLAMHGIIVTTGLARGVDTAAARGALKGGGRVIGVIGSGLNVVYPAENKALFNDVANSGAMISEYPPGTAGLPAHFPMRNRILSGLSLGVAVIEAPKKSGALITATRALEQGRDIFALPGNVDVRNCEGSNLLLREGAIPILSGEDIISEYAELFPNQIKYEKKSTQRTAKTPQDGGDESENNSKIEIDNVSEVEYIDLDGILSALDGDEKTVAETMGRKPMQVDDIIIGSKLSAQQVLTALTMLEIKGHAERLGGLWKLKS